MATKKEKTKATAHPVSPNKKKKAAKKKAAKKKKIPYHRQPGDLSLDRWQIGLREQFGQQSSFTFENLGGHKVFSDFKVTNPETGNAYRVAIRTNGNSGNFCSCLDFKTNRLGTCKHIAFLQEKVGRKTGHKRIFKKGYEQPHSSVYLDYQEGRKIKLSIGTEERERFQRFAKKYFDSNFCLLPSAFPVFEKLLKAARRIHPGFRCYDDALEFVLSQREHLSRNARLKEIFKQGAESAAFGKLLKVKLYPYQKEGVLFAARAGRCLIADEMGLGKTVQAIAAARLFGQEFGVQRVLVVCPTSLKYQWKSEIERFSDSSAHVLEGTIAKRRKQYAERHDFFTIVGYHTVANDLRQLNELEFDLIILDEAQRIKNWQAKTSAAIKKLRSTYAFVLTGTPLENKLEELYSIMQVIDQFRLPPLFRFLDQHQIKDEETGKVMGFKNLKQIGENLSDVLLRRQKKNVLKDLPKRQDKTLLVPMTQDQMDMHREYSDEVAKLVARWVKQRFLKENDRKRLMLNLSMMRMVCDSTYILDQTSRHDTKVDELMCILEDFFTNHPEGKVVVFSQWKRMLHLVEQEMIEREIGYQFLHGSVPSGKRGGLLEKFRDDPGCHVFLSTDAGGVGLNLQAASLVVNLDLPWNPAKLEQRIARVWRMGQDSAVQVVNLVSAGTIEHRMVGVLKFKDSMAKGVLDDGEDVIFMQTTRFNEFMGKMVDLTGDGWVTDTEGISESLEAEAEVGSPQPETGSPGEAAGTVSHIPGDDDVPLRGDDKQTAPAGPANGIPQPKTGGLPSTPEELVQSGVSFLSGLAKTLSDPAATQKLVGSLTAKDEKTGQVYLKTPVENEATVSNALQVLGGLFRAFK